MFDLGSQTLVDRPREPPSNTQVAGDFVGLACTAEVAECTCPEYCERDHDID